MSRKSNILLVILLGLAFLGCPTEEYEILTEDTKAAIQADSEFYDLVERAAMYDGSEDDEIDGSPCFSIRFPYGLNLEGVSVRINSFADLKAFLRNLEGETGTGEMEIDFPVTLKMSDYRNVTVKSKQEFQSFRQACRNQMASARGAITCVEIDFPVKLLVYNTNTQRTNSANFANKEQLYVFLNNREADEVYAFDYPINLKTDNNFSVEINNRAQFEAALSNCR